jgi:ATP-dependent DNA helicase RecQ
VKVLIVAKTRRGGGACVGGITEKGKSVRLIADDAASNERAGLEYEVGEVWEIDSLPDRHIVPPHVENVIVTGAQRLRRSQKLEETIRRFMPPLSGGPEVLFEGLTQRTPAGALYVTQRTGFPTHSTMFWLPDQPLPLDCEGKRIRYRYPGADGGCTLTFVGFQEPLPEIPAGTLLRVSLAHPWRPKEHPDEELRCFLQISGWFLQSASPSPTVPAARPLTAKTQADSALPAKAREVLKQTFGFSQFLPLQQEVISRVLQRQDTLVVMPTGGGKSLCYQLPALLFDGLTAVVAPLIALMQDQVRQLRDLEIPAACLNHMVPNHEWVRITEQIRRGHIKLLYVAPETLLRPETLLLLEQSNLACLAIDEAHCISEWGHDFRPEYRQLRRVRRRFPNAACLLLTATATARVREDIRRLLELPAQGEFVASFNRPNLFLSVEPRRDALAQIQAFLAAHRGQSGIIYCGKRKQTDELCAQLNANGWAALPYHAGLQDDVRRRNQERFIQDDVPLMVATVAFGMGINKSNVRFVIHAHLPKDGESYYQEIGRSGRDGLRADCLLLYSRADAMLHRHFIDQGAASERAGRNARLNALMRFAEVRDCRRVPLLAYFGEELKAVGDDVRSPSSGEPLNPRCGHCDNCAHKPSPAEQVDVTSAAAKFLSCVQTTGELFGPAHIIAVLRGSKSERVLARHHQDLSLHGSGRDLSTEAWRDLATEFLQLGLVEQDLQFGGLRLTQKGRDLLASGGKVLVPAAKAPAPEPRPQPERTPQGQYDALLFERLRHLRRELAATASLPAYMVLSDKALAEMATFLPQTPAQLLAVNGVGEVKLAKYGRQFLAAIRQHVQRHARSDL